MRGVEPPADRQAILHLNRDRVAELHPRQAHQVGPQKDVPFRQIIDKEGSSGREYANAFVEPTPTPFNILSVRSRIRSTKTVGLPEIEWRISEYRINKAGLKIG
jgi:hypothetical protein